MPVVSYEGHEHRPDAGGLVRHAVEDGSVVLRVADDDGGDATVTLNPAEAARLGSTLLRDHCLAAYGSG